MARRERFGEGVVILHHDWPPLPFNGDPACGKMPLNREADGGGSEIMSFVDQPNRAFLAGNVSTYTGRIRINIS